MLHFIPFKLGFLICVAIQLLFNNANSLRVTCTENTCGFPLRNQYDQSSVFVRWKGASRSGSGANPASYPMGTRVSFTGGKAAWAWSWPLTSIKCWGERMNGSVHPLPQCAFVAWCLVKKHRDTFTFTLSCHKFIVSNRKICFLY
jgi:hypothetical protein